MMLPQNNHTLGTINGSYGQLVNRWMVGGNLSTTIIIIIEKQIRNYTDNSYKKLNLINIRINLINSRINKSL